MKLLFVRASLFLACAVPALSFSPSRGRQASFSSRSHHSHAEKKRDSSRQSVLFISKDDESSSSEKSLTFTRRFNTMESAFGEDNYQLSSKAAIAVGLGYLLIKVVRARIMKRGKNVLSAMPTWGYLVSSKEEEMEFLHAYCCKQCGTTIFPARGRDAKFFPKDIECFNCGAKGRENFYDRRKDMDIGDDVDYLSPYDYMSDAEKKIAKLKAENERMAALAKQKAEEDAWLDALTGEDESEEENSEGEVEEETEEEIGEEESQNDDEAPVGDNVVEAKGEEEELSSE